MHRLRWLIYLIFIVSSTGHAFESAVDDAHPFRLSFKDDTPLTVKDFRAEVDFLFEIPAKHYLYKDSIDVKLDNPGVNAVVIKPAGLTRFDKLSGEDAEVYLNQLVVLLKLQFEPTFDFSKELTGQITYQGCSDKICFRMIRTPFRFELDAGKTSLAGVSRSSANRTAAGGVDFLKVSDFQDILDHGFFFALLVTFLAGVVTGFTPCVLPIIPLTLAFIGVSTHEKRLKRVSHLLVFTLGMVLMYASLGVASAALGQTLGFVFQSPVFLVFLILFLIAMALWLFGVLHLNLPTRLQDRIAGYQPQGGFRYLYAGLTIGLLAAPCVGPVLGPLLVYIATTQNLSLGFVLMLSYAIGLSVLFFVLGFFSRDWVTRFGKKSHFIKKVLAVLLLVTAAYYLYVLANPFLARRTAGPDRYFEDNLMVALEKAREAKKKTLVDFYADWCLPCLEWRRNVFADERVKERIQKDFVPVKIDCTQETDHCAEAVARFKIIGWPTILFLDETGHEIGGKRIVGRVMGRDEFIRYLDQIDEI